MKTNASPLLAAFLICFIGLPNSATAGVRLLTGDSNNQVHQRGGEIKDLSADGDLVLFITLPPTTGSAPGIANGGLYLRKISADTLEFVSDTTVAAPGVAGAEMSDDGRYLTWTSTSPRQIHWRDRTAGITRVVTAGATGTHGDPRMSGDGRYVAFISTTRDLIADTSKLPDNNRGALYVYDSVGNSVSIASLAPNGNKLKGVGSGAATLGEFDISGDGRFVVYSTEDPNAHPDKSQMSASFFCVCRRNLATGEVLLLNRDSSGNVADGNFVTPRISYDGSRAVFAGGFIGFLNQKKMIASFPGNTASDLYVKQVTDGAVWGLTKTNNGTAHDGPLGPDHAINDDGSVVAFASNSDKLISGSDTGGGHSGTFDVFRADLGAAGAVTLSQMTLSPTNSGNVDYRNGPFLPGTGNYAAFGTDQLAAMGIPNANVAVSFHGIGVGTFPAAPPSGLEFSAWASVLPADMRGAGDNPSGDGVKNAVKYFVGSDATKPDLRFLPAAGTATGTELGLTGDSAKYLTLSVRIRRAVPAGYTWNVHASETLSGLISDPVAAIGAGVPVADGDFDVHLFRFPTALGGGTGFMRLNVNVP